MTARATLLAFLTQERHHVLAAVEDLTPEQLDLAPVPSGWSVSDLVSHLLWDDEIFWIGAVLLGDDAAIGALRDGWSSDEPRGMALVDAYRDTIARHDALLAEHDLDQPPAWWPEDFPGAPFATGWQVLHRVLAETSTHAGHLDIARELIDGHQHLVLG